MQQGASADRARYWRVLVVLLQEFHEVGAGNNVASELRVPLTEVFERN